MTETTDPDAAASDVATAPNTSLPTYTSDTIQVLEGLEPVQKRPGMYIGDTGIKGYMHCLSEVVDNSVDEFLAGHCTDIAVTLHSDGSASVRDNGRGIPVGQHASGESALDVVFTKLHAGGKFSNDTGGAYKVSGGLHGVGASVVNALSSKLEVTVARDGGRFFQRYADGGKPQGTVTKVADSPHHGTIVRFWLDQKYFKHDDGESAVTFDGSALKESLSTRAHLNPGLSISFADERTGETQRWKTSAFSEILDVICDASTPIVLPIISASEEHQTAIGSVEVMLALRVHNGRSGALRTFANNISTAGGGTHETGFRSAMLRFYNEFASENNLTKEAFTAEDIREGLVAAISVKLSSPEFRGQTKDALGNREVTAPVSQTTRKALKRFFEENPKQAKAAIARAERAMQGRLAGEKARETVERKSPMSIGHLPGKLADCSERDPDKCELYLVEGDSAGGSAKQGRNREFQAVLPLRGKILNVARVRDDKALGTEAIQDIISVLGCGCHDSFDIAKLRYRKVIIMTDADVDGSHIAALLLTLFHRHLPMLIDAGHVFAAMPPLYKISKGKAPPVYLQNEEEKDAFFAERGGNDGFTVNRFKGLGEMNPEQLWETTMDPETRTLVQIYYPEADEPPAEAAPETATAPDATVQPVEEMAIISPQSEKIVDLLMSNKVPPRKEWIEMNSVYADVDA